MVKLSFNLLGYIFQDGANTLRASFLSARDALHDDIERAKEEAIGYRDSVEQGGEWIGECDDDGHVIWDHADRLRMHVEAAQEALMALRKAFVIALYHHWERSALKWVSEIQVDHSKLAARVKALNYPIDPKLDAVRELVNALKHDNDKWGLKLVQSWPDVFPRNFQAKYSPASWFDMIRLTDDHVLEVVSIVGRSGPNSSTTNKHLLSAS